MTGAKTSLTAIELFAGAGGLALGTARAGYEHLAVIELNADACASLRFNSARIDSMRDWPIHEIDAHRFNYSPFDDRVNLIAAGAPCQPFSLAGKHRGHQDRRNLFPEVFRAVRETLPEAVIVENVKGLVRSSFEPYFKYIVLQLRYPEIGIKPDESWESHRDRLSREEKARTRYGASYRVKFAVLNAADFGIPQRRDRVFLVAIRSDLDLEWTPPSPTHSEDALLYAKWVSGSYWDEHSIKASLPPASLSSRISQLSFWNPANEKRWLTVRDAKLGLPRPRVGREASSVQNHVGIPGARVYPGHTGSPIDEPAKTLKAGDHGVPGGENMLRRRDGTVRYFTVREAARMQGFPDEYVLQGSWTEAMRQLGNAVPVGLAESVARSVESLLSKRNVQTLVA